MRIALIVEYDGRAFHGWQSQIGLRTIQNELEKALSHIANHPIHVTGAGRTDRGVHATYQVIHFDTHASRRNDAWTIGANHFLPKDISIRAVYFVPEDFHARFSAISRNYEYWIDNRPLRSALNNKQKTWIPLPLDIMKMHDAAQCLIGTHDFSAFRASSCQAKTPVRTVSQISVERFDHLIVIKISANSFLHHMVRNIVGSLLPIGFGLKCIDSLYEILQMKERAKAGMTMPPDGLYLSHVAYQSKFQKDKE